MEVMRRGSANLENLEAEERALFDQLVADDVPLSQAFLKEHLGMAPRQIWPELPVSRICTVAQSISFRGVR